MNDNWQSELDTAVDRQYGEMVALRRHLHAHPEPSGEEFKTSLLMYQKLGDAGFRVRLGPDGRGVIADGALTENGNSNNGSAATDLPLLALRADMDALHIQDAKNVEYRSTCPNVMHACGHDAHTAIAYGTMCALRELQMRQCASLADQHSRRVSAGGRNDQGGARDDRRRGAGRGQRDHRQSHGSLASGWTHRPAPWPADGQLR